VAFRLGDNIQETAPAPVPGATGDYLIAGAVSGFEPVIGAQYANGDTGIFEALQGTSSITRELFIGTVRTGPNRIERTTILRSTNGGLAINWAGGTVNVIACNSGRFWESLLTPAQPTGLMARTAAHVYSGRTIIGDALLPVTAGDGVAGNPTLSGAHILDKDPTGTEANRTMGGRLVLGATSTIFKGLASQLHKFFALDNLTDQIGEFFRNGAGDWRLRMNIGGSLRRVITATAADLNDADRLQDAPLTGLNGVRGPNVIFVGQTISNQGLLTLAHGFSSKPALVVCRIVCVIGGSAGYAIGDTVEVAHAHPASVGTDGGGHAVYTDTNNINIRFHNSDTVYHVPHKTTGDDTAVQNGHWSLTVTAWR
jgi:hypothetical protein